VGNPVEKKPRFQDRRNAIRVKLAAPASCIRFDKKGWVRKFVTTRSMDIGSGGVRLKSSFPVDLREMLQVTIAFRPRMLTFRGEVVHVTVSEDENLEFGVRIKEINDQDRIALTKFIIRKCRETRSEGPYVRTELATSPESRYDYNH